MIITEDGIKVESYVHTKDGGLAEVDSLSAEAKKRVATELKLRYMNALYRGKATFTVAGEGA